MKRQPINAIVLIAACAISTGAIGQKVYRCGNEYSQIPCSDAITINAGDARNTTQKMESDTLTRQESIRATAMEKERLKSEVRAQNATTAAAAAKTGVSVAKDKKVHPTKKNAPEFFTARAVPDKTQKTKAPKPEPGTKP